MRFPQITAIMAMTLLVLPLVQTALPFLASAASASAPLPGAWNSNVSCTPTTVRITDITANQTGTTSFNTSPFSPGITTAVSGGVAKRWLTPGPTPSGWHSPGPACTITNSFGNQQGVFVEIDGVKRASAVFEDSSTSYDSTNGGTSYGGGTFNDFTFNIWDPAVVSNYGNSCTSASDPTCYGRIHLEIDHDWQAANYCGSGTACDPSALSSQTTDGVTLIDFQGFVYWDPSNLNAADHSFSGWELHPLTGWRIHQASLNVGISFSPSSPVTGQVVTFSGTASGGTSPYTFSWNFGDGTTGNGNPASHTYSAPGSYTASLSVTDSKGVTGTASTTVKVGSGTIADFSLASSPSSLTIQSGSSGTSTINLSSLNSFSGTVILSIAASPSGVTPSLSPTSVTLSSGGSGTSTLTVSSSTAGSYSVTVTGTSGSLSHSTTVSVTVTATTSIIVASDGAVGPSSLATAGGEKLIQDSAGKMIAVYTDSVGRIALAYANSDPMLGGWSAPVKSPTPTSAYARPAVVLVSLTSLRLIVEGGSGGGIITDIPVAIQRDSQNNITGFSFGTPTTIDSSGLGQYPAAFLAHNGDILAAWAWQNSTRTLVKSLRWDPSTSWTNLAGSSTTPDIVLLDSSGIIWFVPNMIERLDNNNVYIMANRFTGPPSTVAFNKATWNGSGWSWGSQNLTYETNASDADDDFVSLAWDPVRLMVVAAYGITGTTTYGVFTLNSQDVKTHMDTPSLAVSGDRGWGEIGVHTTTGDYYIFLINVNTDVGSGPMGYIRLPAGGVWNATINYLDSATDNQVLSLRPTGTSSTLDLLYVEGASAPSNVKFASLRPFNPPDFSASANPSTMTVQSGSSAKSTVTLTSLSGFSGTVSLAASVSPTGLTASLSPSGLALTSGGTGTSTLTVSSTVSATYTVSIVATSGSLSHSAQVIVQVTDFTISSSSSLSVVTGLDKTSVVTFTSLNSFVGTVGVVASVSSSGITASLSPTTITLMSGGMAASTLTLNSSTVGTYTVTVTGTSGSLSHTVTINVNVIAPPDFNVAANPSIVTFPAGSSGTSTVTLTSLNGFAGSLSLSTSVSPVTGLTASCAPTSVILTSGISAISICSFSSSTSGIYVVSVSGTNGTLSRSTTTTVNVSEFSISAIPTSETILASAGGTSTVTLTSLNSFSGTITLALSSSTGITAFLSQTSLGLSSGGTATSTLSFKSATIGNYTLTVTGTSGSIAHSVQVTVRVVDFAVSSSSTSLTIFAGQSGTSTISLSSLGGFAGSIVLTASVSTSGLTASTSPASVSLTSGSSGASTLTVSSSTGGSYAVTVTGTSGSTSHSVQITVGVEDYTISANPSTLGFQSGSNASSTINLASIGSFSGSVSLVQSVAPSAGLIVSCNPPTVSLNSGGSGISTCTFTSSTQGTYTVTITGTSGPLSHTATITVGVGDFTISGSPTTLTVQVSSPGTSSILLNSIAGFAGTINLSTSVTPSGPTASTSPSSVSLSPGGSGSSVFTITSSTAGTYTATVTGSIGSVSHSVQITVNVVDFTVSLNPTSLTILAGSSGTSTILLSSINGFAGTVTLSTVIAPSGSSASVNPTIVTLTSGGSGSSTLTINSSAAGNYTVIITGASGSLTHSIQVTVQIVDFKISPSSTSLSVPPGSSSNSTIALTSINGLSGSLSLAATILPSGPTLSLSPSTVTLSPGGSGSSTLTVFSPSNTTPGVYTVTITATVVTLSHIVNVIINVPDFGINPSPTSVNFVPGSNATSTINLASLGGFTGTVALTATPSSTSLIASLNPASVALSASGSGTSTLTLSSSISGSYTVTVTGMSGSSIHSVAITVSVQDFSLDASPTSLSLTAGSTGTIAVNLASMAGFTGTVSLSAVCSPSGPRLGLSSNSVTLSSGGSGTSTLSVRTFHKTPPGSYTITITATSGSLTHTITVILTVT